MGGLEGQHLTAFGKGLLNLIERRPGSGRNHQLTGLIGDDALMGSDIKNLARPAFPPIEHLGPPTADPKRFTRNIGFTDNPGKVLEALIGFWQGYGF
jgi:hypothetical protein